MAAITAPPPPPPASTSCRLPRRWSLTRIAAASSSPSSRFRPSSSTRRPSSSTSFSAAGSSGGGGEILHVSPPSPPADPPGAPVYVTLPADAVGPGGRVARRRAMGASLAALAAAGVAGIAFELWWGVVERQGPGEYDWAGYLDLAAMARRHGLRVRAILAFHQCGAGPRDPLWCVSLTPLRQKGPSLSIFPTYFVRFQLNISAVNCKIQICMGLGDAG